MAVTIKDIANHLNLAPSTVSKALNDYPHIAPATRERVSKAARELGYYPSAAARDLRRRKTDRIGFSYGFTTTDIGEFASRLINGAVAAAEKAGYNVMLYPLIGDQQEKVARICQTREVEGLLLMGSEQLLASVALLKKEQLPFVILNRQFDEPDVSFVAADHQGAIMAAIQHLVELGHDLIGYVGQPGLGQYHNNRVAGFRQVLGAAGLAVHDEHVRSAGVEPGAGYEQMKRLLDLPNPPTAVMAIHDPLAFECLQAATDAGLRVPEDVALIGSDNLRDTLATQPPLTTIHPPLAEMGRRAMEGLLHQLSDENAPPTRLILPTKLVIRQSTVGESASRPD